MSAFNRWVAPWVVAWFFGCTAMAATGLPAVQSVTDGQMVSEFLHTHLDNLARDSAKGGGEHLLAFAQLIGISQSQYRAFSAMMQQHYSSLFPNTWLPPQAFVHRLIGLLNTNHIDYRPSR